MILALQILLVITSVLVVLLVLLHRAKGGGLSSLIAAARLSRPTGPPSKRSIMAPSSLRSS